MSWLKARYEDFIFWCTDKPFTKIWRGIKDRFDAVVFCLLLLAVGIYSPKELRKIIIDSLKDTK
jgi:hypothetical protein